MVTIKDVANESQVSIQTVSRVINAKGYVSEATRLKVNQSIEKLGYVPNRIASSMVTGRTMTMGMVVSDVSYSYFTDIILGAITTAYSLGYNLILCNSSENVDQEAEILNFLHSARVDGVIMISPRLNDEKLKDAATHQRALVTINRPIPNSLGGSVGSDHIKGIKMAVDHLLKDSRKVIAYMSGSGHVYAARERLKGFFLAMESAGLTVDPDLIVPYTDNFTAGCHSLNESLATVKAGSKEWDEIRLGLGFRGASSLLSRHPEVDAIVCFDDQLAYGALKACVELKRRVPDDVAIIGCNDVLMASQVTPALTTQRIPRYQMGVTAVELLVNRIEGEKRQEEVIFQHELIVRASAPYPTKR